MLEWIEEIGDIHSLYYRGTLGQKVLVAVISKIEDTNQFQCKLNWEPCNYHAIGTLPSLEFAKSWAESYPHKNFCSECNEMHESVAFCEKCGKCLYKNGVHLNDSRYPLEKCVCGKVNFWD